MKHSYSLNKDIVKLGSCFMYHLTFTLTSLVHSSSCETAHPHGKIIAQDPWHFTSMSRSKWSTSGSSHSLWLGQWFWGPWRCDSWKPALHSRSPYFYQICRSQLSSWLMLLEFWEADTTPPYILMCTLRNDREARAPQTTEEWAETLCTAEFLDGPNFNFLSKFCLSATSFLMMAYFRSV